jgi:restriction system-associated AAA family ATPase
LKKCSTSWYESKPVRKGFNDPLFSVLTLDFFVDEKTKQVFKDHFKSSFELFRFFQLLYELNANFINAATKEDVYKSRGFYTDGKLPEAGPEDRVFYFLDYMILKDEGGEKPNERLLREFSDGEHQFLHTMGICLMLKKRRTLLLLDEPETHFNPKWRADFIKILNSSIKAGGTNNFLKDVLLTSHSPFIISDCMPDNVLFFKKNENKLLEAKRATELGLNTYGSSVDYILRNFFKTNLVSSKSFEELKNIIDHGTIDELRRAVDNFGESSQKQFIFKKIYEKMEKKDDN